MEIKAFIEARANGAAPAAPAPPAGQEPRLNLAPAHDDARPEAKPIVDRRGPASTAAAIDDLQAEIKKAQENRLRLDQEIKQLQTKMEALSLKKWQEHASRYDEARPGDLVPLTAGDKYEKLSCRLVDPLIGNAARLRLDCEWKLATSNAATPATK